MTSSCDMKSIEGKSGWTFKKGGGFSGGPQMGGHQVKVHHQQQHPYYNKSKIPFKDRRNRNDSGMVDELPDEYHTQSSSSSPANWEDMIRIWTKDLHSIIEQESDRMKSMTLDLKSDLARYGHDERSKTDLTDLWKEKMKEMIICTEDLMECACNDMIENMSIKESGSSSQHSDSFYTATESDSLEDIPEKSKIVTDDDDDDFIAMEEMHPHQKYRINQQQKRRKNHQRRRRNRRNSTDLKRMIKLILNAKSKGDFMSDLDKLKKNPVFKDIKKRHIYNHKIIQQHNKYYDDDMYDDEDDDYDEYFIHWSDDDVDDQASICSPEGNKNDSCLEVEDIFADWNKLLKKHPNFGTTTLSDVNKIFWDISLEQTRCNRQLSEELQSLSFGDRPDVIIDRCESLEGRAVVPYKGRSKMYWNIFKAWRHNLVEEDGGISGMVKNNMLRKIERPRRPLKKKNRIFSPTVIKKNKNNSWYHFPNKYPQHLLINYPSIRRNSIVIVEDYFDEWKHNFDHHYDEDRRGVRRHSGDFALPSPKKAKVESICIMEKYRKSREEFIALRAKVRIQRARNRSLQKTNNPEDWLYDSNKWLFQSSPPNDEDDDDIIKYFNDWRHNLRIYERSGSVEDVFMDWRRIHFNPILVQNVPPPLRVILTSRFHFKPIEKPQETKPLVKKSSKLSSPRRYPPQSPPLTHKTKPLKHINNNPKVKQLHAKMMKCFAKQPAPRGRA